MLKGLQDDIWAMIERIKAVLEKRSFKEFRGDPGAYQK